MAKVMLVEDDNNLREIYGARLLAEGYEIVSAKDGEEALAMAVKEKPDLIISDIMMPKISGFDMLDILRSTAETKNTKVIMMTALSQAEDKDRADKLGADRYLVKSQVTLEDVARAAAEVLGTDAAAPESVTPEPVVETPAPTPAPTPATEPAAAAATVEPVASTTPVDTPAATPVPIATPEPVVTPEAAPTVPTLTPTPVVETPAPTPAPTPVDTPAATPVPIATPDAAALANNLQVLASAVAAVSGAVTPAATPTPTPVVETPAPTPAPTPATEPAAAAAEAPQNPVTAGADATQSTTPAGDRAQTSVHTKVIAPINDLSSQPPDLNALLAKEEAKEAVSSTSSAPTPEPAAAAAAPLPAPTLPPANTAVVNDVTPPPKPPVAEPLNSDDATAPISISPDGTLQS
jgi:CheY-like chemotaxis protein